MSETNQGSLRKILAFTAIAEIATALVLMADPTLIVALLIGMPLAGAGIAAGRCFGITLLTLGLACLPWPRQEGTDSRAVRAMLMYNALIALYLGYLGFVGHAVGVLLWPAVALHAAVAVALVWAGFARRKPQIA